MKTLNQNPHLLKPSPGLVRIVVGLEVFSALGGFVGGVPFLLDPSGKMLNTSTSILSGTPISNFFLVGLWLAVIFGVGGLIVGYSIWSRRCFAPYLAYLLAACAASWVALENVVFGPSLVLTLSELVFCGPQLASAALIFRSMRRRVNA